MTPRLKALSETASFIETLVTDNKLDKDDIIAILEFVIEDVKRVKVEDDDVEDFYKGK